MDLRNSTLSNSFIILLNKLLSVETLVLASLHKGHVQLLCHEMFRVVLVNVAEGKVLFACEATEQALLDDLVDQLPENLKALSMLILLVNLAIECICLTLIKRVTCA